MVRHDYSPAESGSEEEAEEGNVARRSTWTSQGSAFFRHQSQRNGLGCTSILAAALVALGFVGVTSWMWPSGHGTTPPARPSGGPAESPEVGEAALQAVRRRPMEDLTRRPRRWVELQGGHRVPKVEGEELTQATPAHASDCTQACLKEKGCKYVIICNNDCHMKKADIALDAETEANNWCSTWVYTDEPYMPSNKALTRPSPAPEYTFYLYRTQGPELAGGDYPLENVNAASASGVLWYLQNEMIKDCYYGNTPGERRFGVSRIRRFKLTYKAPQPLHEKGMNFGTLCSFDSGECTGPHRQGWNGAGSGWNSKAEWEEFGFYVGCSCLGDFPHQAWQSGKRYPDAVWYSLPGACPTMNFHKSSEQCKDDMPGGRCDVVTGQGNCTYNTEPAGEIDIDELVGIKPQWPSRKEFCEAGCVEGNPRDPLIFNQDDGLQSRFEHHFAKTDQGSLCPAGTSLTTRRQCEEAAKSIGHTVTKINYDGNFGHLPYGCSFRPGELIWSVSHAPKMHPNYGALCHASKQCTMWWGDIWNPLENKDRLRQMLDMFHKKYPNLPTEDQLRPPPCDYSRSKYFR